MINILIVDDHQSYLQGLESILSMIDDFTVVGTASHEKQLMANLNINHVDVLLLDIGLPGKSGVELCSEILKIYPQIKIIALTMHDSAYHLNKMMKNGASGYVLKETDVQEIEEAIRRVQAGELYICSSMANMEISQEKNLLTKREIEILPMIASGMTNSVIAKKLNVAENTIMTHRTNIMRKLDIHKTVDLVIYAQKNGLIN